LALSRFLRRAAEGACKNRSAAPASARLFRPLDAPGQSCPGPKQSGRSGQKPKKTRRPWLVKTLSAYKRRPGFFLTAFARRSDWYHMPASADWWFSVSLAAVGRTL